MILFSAAYIFFRIIGRHDYLRYGRLSLISLLLESSIFFIWGGFPYLYGPADWPTVHLTLPWKVVGLLILTSGLVVMFTGMAQLGPMRFLGQDASELKSTGLYRLSRNPQIIGCGLFGVGFSVLWPSWYALGWLFLYAAIVHMMVLTEEEHLLKVFGESYRGYWEQTPRYLSFPRLSENN